MVINSNACHYPYAFQPNNFTQLQWLKLTKHPHLMSRKNSYVFLHDLEVGKEAEVKIMICRSWDTHTAYGKFLSTDFIAFDEKGNVIQMTAKNNVTHHFIPRLKEGYVYLLNHFEVIPNRKEYRIFWDNKLMIQLNGLTFLKKQVGADLNSFIRHPFSCLRFIVTSDSEDEKEIAEH